MAKRRDPLRDMAEWGAGKVADFGHWLTSSNDKDLKKAGAIAAAGIGKSFIDGIAKGLTGMKDGGVVHSQAASFATVGPKYSVMPIKDRVVLMKDGGVVSKFELRPQPLYPGGSDPLTFVRQNGLMNKY